MRILEKNLNELLEDYGLEYVLKENTVTIRQIFATNALNNLDYEKAAQKTIKMSEAMKANLITEVLEKRGSIKIKQSEKFTEKLELKYKSLPYPCWFLKTFKIGAYIWCGEIKLLANTGNYFEVKNALERAIERKDEFIERIYPEYQLTSIFFGEQEKQKLLHRFGQEMDAFEVQFNQSQICEQIVLEIKEWLEKEVVELMDHYRQEMK